MNSTRRAPCVTCRPLCGRQWRAPLWRWLAALHCPPVADILTMSITGSLADEDKWRVARSAGLPLTLLIHRLSAKYALINKLIRQHESPLITHNTQPQRTPAATGALTGDGQRKGKITHLVEPDPELSSAQPPCLRAGLGGGPWERRRKQVRQKVSLQNVFVCE